MAGPHYAATIDECAELCDQHNVTLAGATDQPAYSYQHCNAFVYDTETKQCTLKNKRAGNMLPQEGPVPSSMYNPNACTPRYYSGYAWESLTNEINDVFPNATSGMQYQKVGSHQAAWSEDDWGVHGNFCTRPQMCHPNPETKLGGIQHRQCQDQQTCIKSAEYDVRPGAIFSSGNTSAQISRTRAFPVTSMQQCADICSAQGKLGPTRYSGSNAFTFWPEYTSEAALNTPTPGMCVIGHVREPYYQTLTPHDNGAISGFALTSSSRENHRFLFG